MDKIALVLALMMLLGACVGLSSSGISSGTIIYGPFSSHGALIKQAHGSSTETFKLEDANNRRLNTEVALKVGWGNVCLELLDDKGQPTASVTATPGKPALGRGYLVADAFGAVKYRVTATEAENIDYQLRIDH